MTPGPGLTAAQQASIFRHFIHSPQHNEVEDLLETVRLWREKLNEHLLFSSYMGFDSKAVTTPLSKFFLSLANVRKGTQLVLHQECPPGTSCGVTTALAPIFLCWAYLLFIPSSSASHPRVQHLRASSCLVTFPNFFLAFISNDWGSSSYEPCNKDLGVALDWKDCKTVFHQWTLS